MAHGWPFHFLTHEEPPDLTAVVNEKISPWSVGDTPEVDGWKLAANVAIVLSGSLLLGWLAHRHQAKHGFRFTLGNLAVLMLLLGCVMGYGTYRYRLHQAQLAAIDTPGAYASVLEWQPFGPYWLRLLTGDQAWSWGDLLVSIDPVHSRDIDSFPGKHSIQVISPQQIDYDDLPAFADYPNLKGLNFGFVDFKGETAYDDNGNLFSTPLVQRIAACPTLEGINFFRVDVTDADVKVISTLPNLKHLDLSENPRVTNAGLAHLKSMSSLRLLVLWNTEVTDEAVKQIQAELPQCEIEWDGMLYEDIDLP